ncbi:MAG TPA: hypothetical protein VMR81_07400 [Patescibacteria group bacterium]|nr:hypothetical protein [Patescibacteria group bacterium]
MDNPVVVEARKYLETVDFVIDLYDKSFVWASEKVLQIAGYTSSEFTKLHTFDTLDKSVDQEAYKKELAEELANKHGTTTVLCNTKVGKKVRLTIEYQIFELNGGWYRAAKALKVDMLQ